MIHICLCRHVSSAPVLIGTVGCDMCGIKGYPRVLRAERLFADVARMRIAQAKSCWRRRVIRVDSGDGEIDTLLGDVCPECARPWAKQRRTET